MIKTKSKEEIDILREGGKRHAQILDILANMVKPGLSTFELEKRAKELIEEGGDKPAFLNYKPYGAHRPYPAALCVSINDAIVHGIPNEKEILLKEGDIVSLDLGLVHKNMVTDMAITVSVGQVSEQLRQLLNNTKMALMAGIDAAKVGKRVSDISSAIEQIGLRYHYGIVEELAGHGVGYSVHEDPYVPNYTDGKKGPILKEGMVIAIEPMFNLGSKEIFLDDDGYTYRTKDGKPSAHFEHTVVINSDGAEILTV